MEQGSPPHDRRSTKRRQGLAVACAATAILAVGGLAACGDDDDASNAATTTTQTSTTSTTSTTPLLSEPPPGEMLSPGTYKSDEFAVPFEVTLPTPWTEGGDELPRILDIYNVKDSQASIWWLTLDQAVDPADPKGKRISNPQDPEAFLVNHPALDVGPKQVTTIGGQPANGYAFKVEPSAGFDLPECPEKCVPLGTFPDGGGYGWFQGERGKFYSVDGGKVIIMYSSRGEITPQHNKDSEAAIKTIRWTN